MLLPRGFCLPAVSSILIEVFPESCTVVPSRSGVHPTDAAMIH